MSSGDSTRYSSSLDGVVLMSPTCPAERPGEECPPAPVDSAEVALLRGQEVVATTRTDAEGRFQLDAPAGGFVVLATNPGGYPSEDSQPVELAEGATTTVELVVDSGIR